MFLFLDISSGEILLVVLACMLLFGKDRLPGILRGIARSTDYLKKASDEVRQQIRTETGLQDVVTQVRDEVEKTARAVTEPIRQGAAPGEEIARMCRPQSLEGQQPDSDSGNSPGSASAPESLPQSAAA